MRSGLIAVMLLVGGPAVAQQADPYADAYQGGRMKQYLEQRADFMKQVEYLFWAHGCQVLPNEVVISPMLNAIAAGMDPTIIDTHAAGLKADAARRGMAKAAEVGGCAYWHDHPDEDLAVRQRALATAR